MAKTKSITLQLSLPRRWSELTSEMVAQLAYLLSLKLERSELLLRFAFYCAKLKPHGSKVLADGSIVYVYYKRGIGNIPLDSKQLTAVSRAVAWVLEDPALMAAPLLPKRFVTPDFRLFGISLEQYMIADSAYNNYIATKDVKALTPMVAALYSWLDYSDTAFTKTLAKTKVLYDWQLEAVALWWLSVKKWLTKKYSFVFKSADGDGDGCSIDPAETFLNILSSLNEGRMADNEAIRKSDVHEALYQLNSKAKSLANSKNRVK